MSGHHVTGLRWAVSSFPPQRPRATQLIVFSNVDGVFRHPQSPLMSAAALACERLEREGVSVVLCSNKTRAELEQIQCDLGLHQPFIAEAGAAAFVPHGYFAEVPDADRVPGYHRREFGARYDTIVRGLRAAAERARLHVVGFNDMTIEEIARAWQLPLLRARLAKLREYIEPFAITDDDPRALARLARALESVGLHCQQRAGVSYATGVSKPSAAMSWLLGLYKSACGAVRTIGLSGASDDSPLLASVMREAFVLDDDRGGGAIDVHGWAAGMTDLADEMRRRPMTELARG